MNASSYVDSQNLLIRRPLPPPSERARGRFHAQMRLRCGRNLNHGLQHGHDLERTILVAVDLNRFVVAVERQKRDLLMVPRTAFLNRLLARIPLDCRPIPGRKPPDAGQVQSRRSGSRPRTGASRTGRRRVSSAPSNVRSPAPRTSPR